MIMPSSLGKSARSRKQSSECAKLTSDQSRASVMEPVHRGIQVLKVTQQLDPELGLQVFAIEQCQARLIHETAGELDGLKSGGVPLHRQSPLLWNAQFGGEQIGLSTPITSRVFSRLTAQTRSSGTLI